MSKQTNREYTDELKCEAVKLSEQAGRRHSTWPGV